MSNVKIGHEEAKSAMALTRHSSVRLVKIGLLTVLTTLIALFLISPRAFASDFCTELVNATNTDRATFLTRLAAYFSHSEINTRPVPSPGNLFFTTGSGYALSPSCEPVSRASRVLYYPAGIVTLRVSQATMGGTKYDLVATEYGLLVFIPDTDLQQLDGDAIYLFVDGPADVPYTLASDAPRDPTAASACPALAGADAVSKLTTGGINGTARYGRLIETTPRSQCSDFTFSPMERGQSIGKQKLLASDCWAGFQKPAAEATTCKVLPMKLKTVSFKDSVKAFDGIFAAFGHFSPAFADRWPGILNRKPCSGSVAIDTEAKAGVGGDYYIFNASINQTLSVKEELRDEEFYYFNHYNRTAGNDHGVFGVASVLGCTKSVISSFEQVWVYGKYGADDSFTVDAQELTNAWKKLSDLSGYSQPASLSDLYKHGRFLDVGGSVEYFNLREVLRTYIAGLDEVKTEQDDYADPVTKREIVDFYVHLVMATLGHLP